ncbi:MAG: polymer-forming cytoskeletal protein [Polyangiaceae bacterium]
MRALERRSPGRQRHHRSAPAPSSKASSRSKGASASTAPSRARPRDEHPHHRRGRRRPRRDRRRHGHRPRGSVHGNIRAKQSLEIHAPGRLIGNIHSLSIFIERGVEFQGSCRMDAVTAAGDAKPSTSTKAVAQA